MPRAFEWLWQSRALADAEALIGQETAEHRARREECRALFDAAEQLSTRGDQPSEAIELLHQKGLEVSRESNALPAFLPHAHAIVLRRLEEPQRAKTEALRNRLYRVSGVGVVLFALAALLLPRAAKLSARPDLLAGKSWKLSSTLCACRPSEHSCCSVTTDIFFHTNREASPWIAYDLGEPTRFSRLYVKNRQDSNGERAVPLVVEVSDDEKSWREVARRNELFSEWSVGFPEVTARYLRLRVDKLSWLHLDKVELKR